MQIEIRHVGWKADFLGPACQPACPHPLLEPTHEPIDASGKEALLWCRSGGRDGGAGEEGAEQQPTSNSCLGHFRVALPRL